MARSTADGHPAPVVDEASRTVGLAARQLRQAGLLLTGGNLSLRTSGDEYLITRSGYVVDQMAAPGPVELIRVRIGDTTPATASTEAPLHSALYERFPKFEGVCHIHSPYVMALGEPSTWPEMTTSISKCMPVHVIAGSGAALAVSAKQLLSRDDSELISRYGFSIVAPGHGLFSAARTLARALHLVLRIHENAQVAAFGGHRKAAQ